MTDDTSRQIWADGLFAGKTVIVTGGGSGIGFAIASNLGTLGANVVIASRDGERIRRGVSDLRDLTGAEIEGFQTDIRDYDQVKRLFAATEERFGRVHVLVNNAGGQFVQRFEDMSLNGFHAVVENNLIGTFHMCKAALAHMKPRGGGKLINIVHEFVFERGAPEFAHSGAARAGVASLTQTLALELAPYGITANCVAPGIVASPALDEYYGDQKVDGWLERGRESLPLKRLCSPDEVAQLIVFLASPGGDYMTGGGVIRFDGGEYVGNWAYAWPELMATGTPVETSAEA